MFKMAKKETIGVGVFKSQCEFPPLSLKDLLAIRPALERRASMVLNLTRLALSSRDNNVSPSGKLATPVNALTTLAAYIGGFDTTYFPNKNDLAAYREIVRDGFARMRITNMIDYHW